MCSSTAFKLSPAFVAGIVGASLVAWWLTAGAVIDLDVRSPGESGRSAAGPAARPDVFPGALETLDASEPVLPAEDGVGWPGFRGPLRDNVNTESVPLARDWPEGGPPVLWSLELGEGYAAAAVSDGRVYVLDYDESAGADALRCFALHDGRELWRRSYPVRVRSNHGMSRTVPAVGEGAVVALGPKCHVICVDADDGEFRWGIDLVNRYGTDVPPWYAGQCPLIDRGRAIIAPASEALMIAVDLETGEVVWEASNPLGWRMTHSSIAVMEHSGRRMYVYSASGGVAGVDAETGKILWQTTDWRASVNCPMPVPVGDERILLSAGGDAGSMMIRLIPSGEGFEVRTLWKLPPGTFASEQQTPILFRGRLYGVLPKSAGESGRQLVCLDLDGNVVWTSGRSVRFGPDGLGPYLIADAPGGAVIFLLGDRGTLTLVEASERAYRPLARAKVLDGRDAWGPIALTGGKLIVRDLTRMVCLDLREGRR